MMKLLAYAKINLSLSVLFRRDDGFHEVDSLVQTIDLADTLSLDLRDGGGVQVSNDLGQLSRADLAEQAAAAILMEKESGAGVRIGIEKGIPVGAGLGGGSSDAAAVLWALDRMIAPPLPTDGLLALAADIGSDVPLFLVGGRSHVTGRGERVVAVQDCLGETYVLVVPPVRCDTAAVYRRWAPTSSEGWEHRPTLGDNALLAPALSLHPELRRYHSAVCGLDACFAGMSGSGSTFYAAFRSNRAATAAARTLERRLPDARVLVCASTTAGARVLMREPE